MSDPVGFLGLGAMGAPMVRRLRDAGVPLVLWTRNPGRLAAFSGPNVRLVRSPAEVSASCSIVLSCLLNDAVLEEVYLAGGVLASAQPGSLFVDHGTFTPALARRLDARAEDFGNRFIDAPVSGGAVGATSGTLVCMAGGDAAAIEKLRPLLAHYTSVVERIGPAGSGQALKLVNQMLVAAHVACAAEAAALLERMELPAEIAHRALTSGWAASTMLDRNLLPSLTGDYPTVGATIDHLLQVLDVLNVVIGDYQLHTVVEPLVLSRFRAAVAAGYGALDLSAMVLTYRQEPAAAQTSRLG